MLRVLLESFATMQIPQGTSVIFGIVENNSVKTSTEIIADCLGNRDVVYQLQPQLGIPFARNHVLDISEQEGCDFTTFVDDDEVVTPTWLVELLAEITSRELDLIGGPVGILPLPDQSTWLQRSINSYLIRHFEKFEQRNARRHAAGRDHQILLYTNNWMIRSSFLEKTGVRFDERLGLSGGSDVSFCRAATIAGARTGWAPKAAVREKMPPERLSILYQYQRARDQSLSSFRLKYPHRNFKVIVKVIGSMIYRSCRGLVLGVLSLPTLGFTIASSCQNLGFAVGRLKGLFGYHSTHYQSVQGS
jgi:GT2 family glycosyltransferase